MSSISAIYLRLPNWIGDVCMSLPSLDLVLSCGRPVVVCARPWAKDLLSAYPISDFISMSGKWQQDLSSVRSHVKKLAYKNAYGLLLPDSLSSALVFRLSGIASAGYRDDGRSLLLRWPIQKPNEPIHAVQSWHRLSFLALSKWKLLDNEPSISNFLNLQLTKAHQDEALAAIKKSQLIPKNFILIAPTAVGMHKGKIKVWPYFNALTKRLQKNGYTVAMCPPPAELSQAKNNAPTAICLPALSLGSFAALTQHAQLVICNDSGVSHIAAAAQARQLTLFGVTQRQTTGPWSENATCLGSSTSWPSLQTVMDYLNTVL